MEFNRKCFKCDATTELSVKYYTKVSREPRLICNPCRKLSRKPRDKKQQFNKEDWNKLAKESYERLSRKYA